MDLAALVFHTHCLALRTRNFAFRFDDDIAGDADQRFYVVDDCLCLTFAFGIAERDTGSERNVDRYGRLCQLPVVFHGANGFSTP